MALNSIWDILQLGLLYGVVVLGLVISFRIIGFADLTMEGGFALGASVTAVLLALNMPPVVSVLLGAVCGGLAGMVTASLHCFIKINKLLSGIIVLTILYSLNLRIMGKPNFPLLQYNSLFSTFPGKTGTLIFLLFIVGGVFGLVYWLLSTRFGLFMRATGENNLIVLKSGFNPHIFILAGLFLSNFLIALGGGLLCQLQGFSDIGMGNGIIVSMLTSLVIGENIIRPTSVFKLLLAALVGSILFQAVVTVALSLGINPWDLKLAIGVFLIVAMSYQFVMRKNEVSANIGSSFL